jgi:hypothetical protein
MRKLIIPAALAATLALGGCTTGYGSGGYGYGSDPISGVLGSVLGNVIGGNSGYGYSNNSTSGYGDGSNGNEQFARAAVDACGQQAARYGQVSISNVQQTSGSIMQVDGRVGSNYQQRGFYCAFRSDGRIADFRLS